MAEPDPKKPKDRHPELSAPILDLGLEARIALAEQAVLDRDARLRAGARAIVDTLRSKRGAAVRWAAIAGAGAAATAIGYAGYKAWRARKSAPAHEKRLADPAKASSFASKIAAIARIATQWTLKLHREQGVSGSLFAMMRSALWPSWGAGPPSSTADSAAGPSNAAGGLDARP
jgi:hypothetical protein